MCEVHELYQHVVTDPDAFEIVGDQIDLGAMVRENILLEAPIAPAVPTRLRRAVPDVRDRPQPGHPATASRPTIDPRWDALSQLKANLPEQ